MSARWREITLAGVVAFLVVGAGATTAAAIWSAPGSGSGAGSTGTTSAVTLTPGTGPAELYPGGAALVATTATNPNAAPVRIGSLALDTTRGTGGFAVDAAHSACPTTAFGFSAQNNGGSGWTIARNGTLAISMPGALTMASDAPDECQGVVVTTYLTALP